MPDFSIRWSALEARKPYASPFGVTFSDDSGALLGGIAVNGPDLLYYRQFQQAVLRLAGELFAHPAAEASGDPQRAWLDLLATKLTPLDGLHLRPESFFDEAASERRFGFIVDDAAAEPCRLDGAMLADYQELQAALAHLTGRLYRNREVEAVEDPERRRAAWVATLRALLERPSADDRVSAEWPW